MPYLPPFRTPCFRVGVETVGQLSLTAEVQNAWQATRAIAEALQAAVIVFRCPAGFIPAGFSHPGSVEGFNLVMIEHGVRSDHREFMDLRGGDDHTVAWIAL